MVLDNSLKQKDNHKKIRYIIYAIIFILTVVYLLFYANKVYSEKKLLENQSRSMEENLLKTSKETLEKSDKTGTQIGLIAEKLINKGFTNLGLIALDVAVKKSPDCRDLAYYAATTNYANKNYDKAKEYSEQVTSIDPLFSQNYELLGAIYQQDGNNELAQLCYNKVKDFSR